MTLEEFKSLRAGEILHHTIYINADGTPVRWKINGSMQGSLKTGSARWPLKHGIRSYDYLTLKNLELLNRVK